MPETPHRGGDGTGPESPAEYEERILRAEARLGEDALAQGLSEGLRAMARAARSFLLYEPGNEAIRHFLERYEADMLGAVRAIGAARGRGVQLEIRPFEIAWDRQVVYREEDRERSLAFRMFRDGVRRLDIGHEVGFDELLSLLRILSIRYTGVRQQEEDIVTLLWKAGFKHIEIVAVEGFVPEESLTQRDPDEEWERRADDERKGPEDPTAPPRRFDATLPTLPGRGRAVPAPVSRDELEAVRHEATSRTLPALCVRLLTEMLAQVADPEDPTSWEDVQHLVEEVRDFLLAEGQLDFLTETVRAIEDLRAVDARQVDLLVAGFVDARALRRIVHSIPADQAHLPPELGRLLDSLPGHHLETAIDTLVAERSEAARHVGRQIIARYAEDNPELVLDRIAAAEPGVACDLVEALSQALPRRRLDVARRAIQRGGPGLLAAALQVLGRVDDDPGVGSLLLQVLDGPDPDARLLALEQLTGRHAVDLFDAVHERFLARARSEIEAREADAYGRALVALDAGRATPLLMQWVRPPPLWKRLFTDPRGQRWLQWAAVSGLGIVPGPQVEKEIRALGERAGEDLARHCREVIMRRRQEARRG